MQAKAVIAVLVAVFVATECYSPPSGPYPPMACYKKVDECSKPLQQNEFISGESTDYRTLINDIDGICADYHKAADCLRPSAFMCEGHIQPQLNVGFAVGDYLCSEEGKEALREFQHSDCYDDPTKIYEIQGFTEYCAAEAMSAPPEPSGNRDPRCQAMETVFGCVKERTTHVCGRAAGQLVTGIADGMISVLTGDACEEENPSEFLKRHLDFLVRRK